MTSLTDLYAVILLPLLTEWIKIDEFVMLDCAFCNRHHRTKLFRLDFCFIDASILKYTNETDFINWLDIREIKVNSFNLTKYSKRRFDETILRVLQRTNIINHIEMPYCYNLLFIIESGNSFSSLDLSNTASTVPEESLVHLLESIGKNLTALSMPHVSESMLRFCLHLTELVLTNITAATTLSKITQHCRFLTKFRVLSTSSQEVTDDEVIMLAESFPELTTFAVPSAQLTDRSMCKLVRVCSGNLTSLDISHCKITDTTMFTIAQHCKLLQVFSCKETLITDGGVSEVSKRNNRLTSLVLDDCILLTDVALFVVAWNCPKLSHVSLARCTKITDVAWFDLMVHCGDLQSANVKSTKIATMSLLRAVQNCEVIELNWYSVSDEHDFHCYTARGVKCCTIYGLLDSSMTPGMLTILLQLNPTITELTLFGLTGSTLNDEDMISLFQACSRLVNFTFDCDAPQVTAVSVVKLFELCPLLHSVELYVMATLTDDIVMQILSGKQHMRCIEFCHCNDALTDITVNTIAHQCPNLLVLTLSGNSKISTSAVSILAFNCRKLTSLDISGSSVGDTALYNIAQCLSHLRYMDVTCCAGLSLTGIAEFLIAYPQLEDFHCDNFSVIS